MDILATINTAMEFETALTDNKCDTYQAPYYITKDGGALSQEAAEENKQQIVEALNGDDDAQWHVTHKLINWENQELYCDHTSALIPAVY